VVQYQKIFTYESVICSKVLTIKGPWLKRWFFPRAESKTRLFGTQNK
jgi:hypothetical protein